MKAEYSPAHEPVEASAEALHLIPPQVICSCEQSRSFQLETPEHRPAITSPEAAAELLLPLLRGRDREYCMMLALDTKHRLIAVTMVSVGSVDHTFMSPREIFRDALAQGASALVLGHNHPSGDASPSQDDRAVTQRLRRAGDLVGIDVLDHLVIGSHDWTSIEREAVR